MFAFKKVQKSFPASLFIALVGTKELCTSISVNTGGCFLCHDPYDTGNIKTEIDRKGDRHGENRHRFRFLPSLNEQ